MKQQCFPTIESQHTVVLDPEILCILSTGTVRVHHPRGASTIRSEHSNTGQTSHRYTGIFLDTYAYRPLSGHDHRTLISTVHEKSGYIKLCA